jgi:hypothetical protein
MCVGESESQRTQRRAAVIGNSSMDFHLCTVPPINTEDNSFCSAPIDETEEIDEQMNSSNSRKILYPMTTAVARMEQDGMALGEISRHRRRQIRSRAKARACSVARYIYIYMVEDMGRFKIKKELASWSPYDKTSDKLSCGRMVGLSPN